MGSVTAVSAGNRLSSSVPNLSSQKSLKYPGREVLLEVLKVVSGERKPAGEIFNIQMLVLSYLGREHVLQLTRDLPSGWDSYKIDDVLKYAQLKPVCCSNVIDKEELRTMFGDAALLKQGLEFEEAPSLQNLQYLRILEKFASIPVEKNAGFTLIIFPKGSTLNKLIALAETKQIGVREKRQDDQYKRLRSSILAQFGNTSVEGVVAITNGLLSGSKLKSFKEQSALVASHGCQIPQLVEAIALVILNSIHSSNREEDPVLLLSKAYTRCIEASGRISNSYRPSVIVGGFSPLKGLLVGSDDGVDDSLYGVVAVRRL